jgi:hypothetical protein
MGWKKRAEIQTNGMGNLINEIKEENFPALKINRIYSNQKTPIV